MYTPHNLHTILPLHPHSMEKLQAFVHMIIKWQKAVNLVSKHTIPQIWHRHIADSIQIYPHFPKTCKTIADLGSGAGLPGIVLAILAQDPHMGRRIHITLIESDKKKSLFLQHCVRELGISASVINARIEHIVPLHFDSVTARALCNITLLCDFMAHLQCPQGIFLKGQSVDQDIKQAESKHRFVVQKTESLTQNDSFIVSIRLIPPP